MPARACPDIESFSLRANNERLWQTQNWIRMPVQFLTDEERERLSNFPEQIEEEDIVAFFTLSASDMKEIHKQRGERNKLGYPVNDEDVSYQWPTKFAGINVHGKISFNIEEERNRKGLRPLRKPDGK